MNEKKKSNSCIDKHRHGFESPIGKFQRYKGNVIAAYQRVKYGYCYKDVWSIDWWFLSVMPNMLDDLRKTTHGYPSEMRELDSNIQAIITDTEKDAEAIKKWDAILAEMAFFLREANEETCTKENPYEKAIGIAHAEFRKKYGELGEKLKTLEEIEEEKEKGVHIVHTFGDAPEYQALYDKYLEECRKIIEYRNECKDKGLEMFGKCFWNLWD